MKRYSSYMLSGKYLTYCSGVFKNLLESQIYRLLISFLCYHSMFLNIKSNPPPLKKRYIEFIHMCFWQISRGSGWLWGSIKLNVFKVRRFAYRYTCAFFGKKSIACVDFTYTCTYFFFCLKSIYMKYDDKGYILTGKQSSTYNPNCIRIL